MTERVLTPVFVGEVDEARKEAGRVQHLLMRSPDKKITMQNYEEKMAKAIQLLLSVDEAKQVTFIWVIWDLEKELRPDPDPITIPFGSWAPFA